MNHSREKLRQLLNIGSLLLISYRVLVIPFIPLSIGPGVNTMSVHFTVAPLADIFAPIWPSLASLPVCFVLAPLTFVAAAISPYVSGNLPIIDRRFNYFDYRMVPIFSCKFYWRITRLTCMILPCRTINRIQVEWWSKLHKHSSYFCAAIKSCLVKRRVAFSICRW